ncbi:MFS transporter [Nocardiopsis sp. N85]|uniref:MFS transporter n=1 Tax=Nocardiopsis sp. N85 TaxID=3029400 RepID=UPI00237F00E1|nr:MFS transporter [Nocardiopsis sp. N85]MDE3722694.1 MFS transporter [Nocardiopsis sp. N85]
MDMNRERTSARTWFGLVIVLGPVLLVAMDASVLYLAMPRVIADLAPSADQALWILDSYSFVVGSLLIAFGNLGDRYGRLRLLMIGAVVFGTGSVGAALSPTPEALIGCRVLMGLGGATLLPSSLAVIGELFADPRRRTQAIGIFAATFAAGFAIGPVVGGLLLSRFPWGSVFLINVPVVVGFLVLAPIVLREVRAGRPGRIDVASVALSAGGLLLAVYAVKDVAAHGIAVGPMVAGLAGTALLVWFVRRQRTLEHPLMDVGLFRDRVFTVAIITSASTLVVWAASIYLTGIHLQSVLGLPVLIAALLALPGAAVLTLTCVGTPVLVRRIGARAALITAHFCMGAGLLLLLTLTATGGVGPFVAATMIAGVGYGISFSLVADIAVSAAPSGRAGAAAALAETGNELGHALGIALLGSLAALIFRLLGPDVAGTLDETLRTPGLSAAAADRAREAFVTGLHVTVAVGGALCLALGVLALRWIPREGPPRQRESAEETAPVAP